MSYFLQNPVAFLLGFAFAILVMGLFNLFFDFKINKSERTEEIAKYHDAINKECGKHLIRFGAIRSMVFFTINGDYFKNGFPLKKIRPYNEKVNKEKTKRFKDTVRSVDIIDFEESLTVLLEHEKLNLDQNNDYEGLAISKEALYIRNAKSGCYFAFTKDFYVVKGLRVFKEKKLLAIWCLEFESENLPFDCDFIIKNHYEDFMVLKSLIEGKHDFKEKVSISG